jgi:uncharacterized protein with HEPN domain
MDKYGLTPLDRLTHIRQAIEKIQQYCKNVSEKQFITNELISNSVLFQFLVIGEAIQYVDEDILKKYSYSWHLPRSFRNYIAHEYFGINLKQVYKTVTDSLPEFRLVIETIIKKEF